MAASLCLTTTCVFFMDNAAGRPIQAQAGQSAGDVAMVVGAENLGASIKRTPPRERPLLIDSVQRGNLYGMGR